nr:polymorphic toxin type 17 domain-containing protein [uncultured Streptomyces sp.]
MRAAGPGGEFGLPNQGRIRYVPPKNYNPATPLPRGRNGGYIDRFGNEWTVGPSRTEGHPFEWDVQLSRQGREKIGWLSRDKRHVNVDPFGEVTDFDEIVTVLETSQTVELGVAGAAGVILGKSQGVDERIYAVLVGDETTMLPESVLMSTGRYIDPDELDSGESIRVQAERYPEEGVE